MKKSLSIIGAGAWGSALAIILSDKFDEIFLIDRDKEIIKKLGKQHPVLSRPFTKNITLNHNISSVAKSESILIATPCSNILCNCTHIAISLGHSRRWPGLARLGLHLPHRSPPAICLQQLLDTIGWHGREPSTAPSTAAGHDVVTRM